MERNGGNGEKRKGRRRREGGKMGELKIIRKRKKKREIESE